MSKQQQTKKNALPRNRAPMKAGPKRKTNRPRNSSPQINAAPAATSQSLRPFTKFMKGPDSGSISMHTCVPIAELLSVAVTALGVGAIHTQGAQSSAMTLSLTKPLSELATVLQFTSPVYDLIASAFTRYRVRKVVFHYLPQSSSTSVVVAGTDVGMPRMVFAFAEDPEHPLIMSTSQNSQNLLAVSDSIPFAPWNGWSLDVTQRLESKKLYYTYGSPNVDVQRFDSFGAISCVTDTLSSANHYAGVLYMETIIDLVEFCPITVNRPTLALMPKEEEPQPVKTVVMVPTRRC